MEGQGSYCFENVSYSFGTLSYYFRRASDAKRHSLDCGWPAFPVWGWFVTLPVVVLGFVLVIHCISPSPDAREWLRCFPWAYDGRFEWWTKESKEKACGGRDTSLLGLDGEASES